MKPFLWIPGRGSDPIALSRLRSRIPCPREPMGEAWFNTDKRRMYPELLGDLNTLSIPQLQDVLTEIASGNCCFGPHEEWSAWFHYLLGALLPRSHETHVSGLLEHLITAFITIYPNGLHAVPYPEFRDDVLLTLGQCMMEPGCWDEGQIVIGRLLHRSNHNPNQVWCWWDASGDLSSSLCFCLKYLPEAQIANWFRSVLAIPSPHWRAQLVVWLVGAHELLHGRLSWPADLPESSYPAISWHWSHYLKDTLATHDQSGAPSMSAMLPDANRLAVLEVLRRDLTRNRYQGWLASINEVCCLQSELGDIPQHFEQLYL